MPIFPIATCQTYIDLPKKCFYEKVLFSTQLSHHLMRELLKNSQMVSINDPLLANHSSLTIDTSEARFLLIPSKPGIGKADFRVTGPVPEPL